MRIDNSARSGGIIKISLIFDNIKVCCVFSLESPHCVYTQYTVFKIKKENHTKLSQNLQLGFVFPRDPRMSSKQSW